KRIRSQPPDLLSRSPDPLCLETARSPRRCSTVSNRLRHHLFLSPSRAHPHRLCHHNQGPVYTIELIDLPKTINSC
ncbi:unnamed protein product, partial [Brassica oleracea var. botrytis]